MNRLLDDDQDLQRDRELTLSTGAILAIFLGLVLLCALFFGFGYNLGRKSTVPVPGAPAATPAAESAPSSDSSTFNNFKPSPSSPATSSHDSSAGTTVTVPASSPATTPAPAPVAAAPAHHEPPVAPKPVTPAPAPAHTAVPTAPITVPSGSFVVQVAAVSRKDDADLLVNALHAKGYEVAARTTPQDKLLHIQVGPFATRTEAEAMREKLIMDGYNAIVK